MWWGAARIDARYVLLTSAGFMPRVSGAPRSTPTTAFASNLLRSTTVASLLFDVVDGSPHPPRYV